jgi:beta propeller repeat protein
MRDKKVLCYIILSLAIFSAISNTSSLKVSASDYDNVAIKNLNYESHTAGDDIFRGLDIQDAKSSTINGVIADGPEKQINPKVYNNTIIWEEERADGSHDVHAYNLSNGLYSVIGNSGRYHSAPLSDIYQDRIVYVYYRYFHYDIQKYIAYYNLTTQTTDLLTMEHDFNDSPAIYGDIVTWGHYDPFSHSGLSIYNLSNGVSLSRFHAYGPPELDLYENIITIIIGPEVANPLFKGKELHTYNILTDSTKQITYNYLQNACFKYLLYSLPSTRKPSILGDRVVWSDARNSEFYYPPGNPPDCSMVVWNWDIYFYNLTTSSEVQITSGKGNQTNPSIYGDKVVFQDDRNGNWDLYMHDLTKNKEFRITNNPADQINPEIYENKIVWQDHRNGNWDIYMADLDLILARPEATPSPQEVHGNVNISATVFHAQPISNVWINIQDPTGSTVGNFSMSYDAIVDEYYYNATYSILGNHNFTIWAKDAGSNWTSSSGSFSIQDMTKPSISDILYPSSREVYEDVQISAEIVDNYELNNVWINITNPNTEWANNTMDKGLGDTYYFTQSYAIIGSYSFTIWTKDSSDNWNKSQGLFSIKDTSPPSISNLNILPNAQEIYGNVNISATVTDNYALSEVSINILKPDATWSNETMSKSGNKFYYNRSYDILGPHSFTIWTNDTSNNWHSSSGAFLIQDSAVPYSSVIPIAPYWYSASPLKIVASVNEVGSGIRNVTLWYRYSIDNSIWSSWTPYQALEFPPWEWSFDFLDGNGFYEFFSIAADNGDNIESMKSVGEALAAYDSRAPQSHIDPLPYWKSSSPVVMTAYAGDETSGLKEVSLYYRHSADNLTWPSYSLLGTDSAVPWEWDFDFPNGDGYYEFYTIASDNVGLIEGLPPTSDTMVACDRLPPVIMHVPEFDVIVGEPIRIVAYVNDMALKNVKLNYTDIIDNGYNVNMVLSSGLYIYEFPGYAKEGCLSYSIWAEDHAGNSALSAIYRVEISDPNSPEISNIRTTEIALGKGIEVTTTVTDNIAVDRVILHYKGTGDSEFGKIEMVLVSGNDYSATIPPQSEAGTITYSIQAIDTNGNTLISGPYYVPIPAKPTENILPTTILLGLYGIAFLLIALYYFERKRVKGRKQ